MHESLDRPKVVSSLSGGSFGTDVRSMSRVLGVRTSTLSLGGGQGFELRGCGFVPPGRGECKRQPVLLARGREPGLLCGFDERFGVDVLWEVEHPIPIKACSANQVSGVARRTGNSHVDRVIAMFLGRRGQRRVVCHHSECRRDNPMVQAWSHQQVPRRPRYLSLRSRTARSAYP